MGAYDRVLNVFFAISGLKKKENLFVPLGHFTLLIAFVVGYLTLTIEGLTIVFFVQNLYAYILTFLYLSPLGQG